MSDILERNVWKHPGSYGGHSPEGHYVVASITRDATILAESNWAEWRAALSPEDDDFDAPVYTFRASHWAVGWAEYLIIRNDAPADTLDTARELLVAEADCVILNEIDYSERQWSAMHQYWDTESLRSRVEYCAEAGESIFAARRDCIPESVLHKFYESEMFY